MAISRKSPALQRAHFAGVQPGLQRLEIRIEASIEAQQQPRAGEPRSRGAGARKVEIDRLLAEDRLARRRRGQAVIEVGVGGAGDDHADDLGIGERRLHGSHGRADLGGDAGGRFGYRIDHVF
jgi:hypothetical protein